MDSDLISRSALIERFNDLGLGEYDPSKIIVPDGIYAVIKTEPAAVVRCKECRNSMLWRKPLNDVIGDCLIRKMYSDDELFCQVGENDFCSYGDRRDNR